MNNVLYHLHPVKVKRHAAKVSYTLCLGGLSFFLFILLTVTGIFLMFFYRPTETLAWSNVQQLETAVWFGSLVRNMHRWGAHLMVLTVFLHMSRAFYHGAYKAPREFNWVIGVILLFLTLMLSFTGYLLPWDQLALWAVTVGTNMMGYSPVFGGQIRYALLGSKEISGDTLLRWYTLHVLYSTVRDRRLHGCPLWRVAQGRRPLRAVVGEDESMPEIPEHLLKCSAERRKQLLGLPTGRGRRDAGGRCARRRRRARRDAGGSTGGRG
jgi:hypothetical protein